MYCAKMYFNVWTMPPGSKKLVAYFSPGGTTKKVAENLASMMKMDRYEILPKYPYSKRDLDRNNPVCRCCMEHNDPESRPELLDTDAPIEEHDIIFLGFPIWWDDAPQIIRTFLGSYSFSWKNIILFATSGGSDIKGIDEKLRPSAPKAYFVGSRILTGNEKPGDVYKWADSF